MTLVWRGLNFRWAMLYTLVCLCLLSGQTAMVWSDLQFFPLQRRSRLLVWSCRSMQMLSAFFGNKWGIFRMLGLARPLTVAWYDHFTYRVLHFRAMGFIGVLLSRFRWRWFSYYKVTWKVWTGRLWFLFRFSTGLRNLMWWLSKGITKSPGVVSWQERIRRRRMLELLDEIRRVLCVFGSLTRSNQGVGSLLDCMASRYTNRSSGGPHREEKVKL